MANDNQTLSLLEAIDNRIESNRLIQQLKKPIAIICDIEGTTTSVRFWPEVLLPFIRDNLEECLCETWNHQETIDVIALLRIKTLEDIANGDREKIIESVISNVVFQMNQKRQSNELKSLHLLVWLYGYRNDKLKGHVYADVMPAFDRWKNELGIRIFTFASGDHIIQKMFFTCSLYGNLNSFIEDYFNYDLVGRKTESESFKKIAKIIQVNSNNILFLSDNLSGMIIMKYFC
ncbi:hypothetical protein NH340_JMT01065 [Sarcoptes scabiei]|nr:hypothetical protein NH340_JMT01065 [Sarcoptes scabiei]